MTREEAIVVLNVVDENASCYDCLYYNQMEDCPTGEDCIIRQALWMAISALEQQNERQKTLQKDIELAPMADKVLGTMIYPQVEGITPTVVAKPCEDATVCDIDAIRAEIQKVMSRERDLSTDNAKAQYIALGWCLEVIDKYTKGD